MQEVSEKDFDKEVLKSDKPVITDFWAKWCNPCLAMIPIFEELSKELKGLKFVKVNVDENQHIPLKYGVMGIPTFIVFKNGNEVLRQVGAISKEQLKAKLQAIIK